MARIGNTSSCTSIVIEPAGAKFAILDIKFASFEWISKKMSHPKW
jgi:hypothetical protein